jgi:hypothetical protein
LGWPRKFALKWGPGVGCVTLLGFTVMLGGVTIERWDLHRKMTLLEPLDESSMDELSEGDQVWLDVHIIEVAEDEPETWYKDYIYGCKEYWDSSEDGEWVTDSYYYPPLLVHHWSANIVAQLPVDCPGGDYAETDEGSYRYLGYRGGQRLSLVGTVQSPSLVEVEYHRGGSPQDHKQSIFWTGILSSICFGIALITVIALVWRGASAVAMRRAWTSFAYGRGLNRTGGRFALGRIHGEVRGREVEIRRRRGLGDGESLPSDVAMILTLNPCMKPYKMRGQLAVERWLLVIGGEAVIGDDTLDPLFVLQGVDQGRWTALLTDPEVKQGLEELRANRVQIRMDEGELELTWPGLEVEVMDNILDKAIDLAERMERVEGRGWADTARALSLEFEMDEQAQWKMEDTAVYLGWKLRYHPYGGGWQTRLDMRLPVSVPSRWSLESSSSAGTKQRSGDPVIDAQIALDGFEAEELEALIKMPDATETLLAAICGHGLLLEEQTLALRQPGLVPEPGELIQDALRLARMVEKLASEE